MCFNHGNILELFYILWWIPPLFFVKNNGSEKFIFILFLITCKCQHLFSSNIAASMTWVQKTIASCVFSNRDKETVRISVFSSKLPREWQVTNHYGQEEMEVYMSTVFFPLWFEDEEILLNYTFMCRNWYI